MPSSGGRVGSAPHHLAYCTAYRHRAAENLRSGMKPASRYSPGEFKPTDAMHPHCDQSGLPPFWQGVIGALRSAEMQAIVCEKMHSL